MTSRRTRDRLVQRLRDEGITNHDVLNVIGQVPRHIFVDEALASRAYEDTALPIGAGQTISQPYIVARMTEALLADGPINKVLEIGSGSGYQTAILAALVEQVFSVERLAALQFQARERMHLLRISNVRMKQSDGNDGWSEHAPYTGIVVTAAPLSVPQELLAQLAPGGRMVIPVGASGAQKLLLVTATLDGYTEKFLEQVSFVPMISGISDPR